MHNHQQQNSEGALIAVLLIALIIGGLLIGGGYLFWTRATVARVQAVQSEMMARTEAEHARQLAMELQAQLEPESSQDVNLIEIKIEANRSLLVDGELTKIDELHEILQTKFRDGQSLGFSIKASDQCTVAELKELKQICESFGNVQIDLGPKEDTNAADN